MDQVTSELLVAARKGKRSAAVELLAMHYPTVWRMASGLTGRRDVGRGVVRFVMQRSLRVMSAWADDGAPTRWFHHHTLLTTRRTHKHPPAPGDDTLLSGGPEDPSYVGFIRALRALPMQQREAFILHHGEGLGIRAIGVAMDCSVLAAENHLREASERLGELASDQFNSHIARLKEIYRELGPDEELAVKDIRRRVRRLILPWFIKRILRMLFAIALLAAAVWAGWWVWRIVEHSLR